MATSLDVVVPVLNEENNLSSNISELEEFLSHHLDGYEWKIIIADNGSTDSTLDVAKILSGQLSKVEYTGLKQRGRGIALREAWLTSEADILAYMDLDLSTELNVFPALVEAIRVEGYDIAIGSRLKAGARVIGRSFKRELTSRSYSLIFRIMFLTDFIDAQCGFKALSRRTAQELVPLVRDTRWFFDTELLVLAEKNGYRIKEIPVTWTDDPDSRVKLIGTAYEDMKGLLRLRFGGLAMASEALSRRRKN